VCVCGGGGGGLYIRCVFVHVKKHVCNTCTTIVSKNMYMESIYILVYMHIYAHTLTYCTQIHTYTYIHTYSYMRAASTKCAAQRK
jgi:hypothetical protein